MDSRKRYSLSKRPTTQAEADKKRAGRRWRGVWYVRWRQSDGTYSSAKSTGHENKADAIAWCESQIDADTAGRPRLTLGEYAEGFFDWPDGRYVTDRRAGGHRVSYRSAQSNRTDFQNHVLRLIPPDTLLRDIGRATTRRLRDQLFREGRAPSTINHIVNALSIVLQAAEEDGIIAAVPRMYRAGGSGTPRGVLSMEEARELFASGAWADNRARVANLLAAATGLRQSEIAGLTRDRVHADHVDVRQVWDRNAWRLKPATKNDQPRVVPVSAEIRRELAHLIHASPHGRRGFVFWHKTNPQAPMEPSEMTQALYRALESIGMSEPARKAARIDFHSWRHFANSRLVESGIPETTVRAMIGHQSGDMTLNYYHASDLAAIAGVQGSLVR